MLLSSLLLRNFRVIEALCQKCVMKTKDIFFIISQHHKGIANKITRPLFSSQFTWNVLVSRDSVSSFSFPTLPPSLLTELLGSEVFRGESPGSESRREMDGQQDKYNSSVWAVGEGHGGALRDQRGTVFPSPRCISAVSA